MKKKKLDPIEFVELASEDAGTTKHKHQNCEDGPDHKKRLYVTREEDGAIVAFCHNCQRGGAFKEKGYVRNLKEMLEEAKPPATATTVEQPDDVTLDTGKWPLEIRAWLYKYGLTDAELWKHDISYSPAYKRLIIPVYDIHTGDLTRWQGRSWHSQPKHITVQTATNTAMFTSYTTSTDTVVFITEDFVSAMRLGKLQSAVCLSGVHMSTEQQIDIAKQFKHAVIFLDDDNATVRKAQRTLLHDLDALMEGNVMIYSSGGRDPKEHGFKELEEVVEKCILSVRGSKTAPNVLCAAPATT